MACHHHGCCPSSTSSGTLLRGCSGHIEAVYTWGHLSHRAVVLTPLLAEQSLSDRLVTVNPLFALRTISGRSPSSKIVRKHGKKALRI